MPAPGDPYGDAVWADSPVAWWRMGEASGSVIDYMGGTSGTVSGSVTRDVAGPTGDSDDGCIDFTGGHVSVPGQAALDLSGSVTIEAWIFIDTMGDYGTIFEKYHGDDTAGYSLHLMSAGGVRMTLRGGGTNAEGQSDPGTLTTGVWYHVVTAFDDSANTVTLYVDTAATVRTGVTQTVAAKGAHTDPIGLGARVVGGAAIQFDGKIDELAIYSGVLSSARVAAHFAAASETAGQILVPDADVTTTGWLATPLWSKLDDAPSSPDGVTILSAASAYAVDTLANGDLLAYWRLNDTGATAVDSAASFDLTILSGWTKGVAGLIDDPDTAMTGDGSNIIGFAGSGLNPWSGAFTIELWAREEVDLAGYGAFFSQESFGVNGFRFGRREDTWAFWCDESGGDLIVIGPWPGTGIPVVDATTYMVFTRSGTTYKLYIDGTDQTTTISGSTYVAPAGGASVGGAAGIEWKGTLDEIAVYSSAKDASWVAARYALGS